MKVTKKRPHARDRLLRLKQRLPKRSPSVDVNNSVYTQDVIGSQDQYQSLQHIEIEDVPNTKSFQKAPSFVHTPLDLSKRSIRLIRVLRDLSPRGHIQCEMRHATVSNKYTCLSYVWGENSNNTITVNGQLHSVRNNLLTFLQVAQRKRISRWLWIDAICIDQVNIKERTHQVQQMDHVFSNALEVFAWLGADTSIAHFLHSSYRLDISSDWVRAFVKCDYWKRAWVTQEIFLARRVMLMAGDMKMPLEGLPHSIDDDITGSPDLVWPDCFLGMMWPKVSDWRSLRGTDLVRLVLQLKDKLCVESQDRVYSILGICGQGSDLAVDYARSDEQLALAVLSSCKKSFCLCTLLGISKALGVDLPDASLNCHNNRDVWQHHVDVAIPLAMPTDLCSHRNKIHQSITHVSDRMLSIELSRVCCEDWSWAPHAHYTRRSQSDKDPELTISIPCRYLCGNVDGGFVLQIYDGCLIGFCYADQARTSDRKVFQTATNITEHARYDGLSGTLTLSLAVLLWLEKLWEHAANEGARLWCCSAVEEQQSVLRLGGD